jgi:hypothetical protein
MAEDRIWTVEEADAARPRVGALVERAQAAARAIQDAGPVVPTGHEGNGHTTAASERHDLDAVLRELAEDGIVIKDLAQGLIDFPARSPSGRAYWLCWIVDEPAVAWWHWPEDGFAGRTPLDQPPQ